MARHRQWAMWRSLWLVLAVACGAPGAVSLGVALLLAVRQAWVAATLAALGLGASGMATRWTLTRWRIATREEEDAYTAIDASCSLPGIPTAAPFTQSTGARDLREALRLFGRLY